MKKITLLFSAVLLIALSFYSCEQSQIDPADPESTDFVETKLMNKVVNPDKIRLCGEQECYLKAGRNGTNIGTVTVSNDDENLYVTVYSEVGFKQDAEYLKIWVGKKEDLPTERPPSGHFPFKTDEVNGGNAVTYQIPYSELGINTDNKCEPHEFSVIVHVDAGNGDTAYGGCEEFGEPNGPTEHKKWWYYMDYYTQCCECWCAFGNDYQSPEDDACLSMMFEGERYIFWSNRFKFKEFAGENKNYEVSLLVNPTDCTPQDTKGNIIELLATDVGTVEFTTYIIKGDDGKSHPYVDVKYNLYEKKYKGYNIQLDFYLGVDKIPKVNRDLMQMITDDDHMLYQHKLTPGETTYTFTKIPWVENKDGDTFIALHAAIGDCPMPSLQNPMP